MNTNRGLKLIYSRSVTFLLPILVINVKEVRGIE